MKNNELYHHGIKGQRWGVRRYQNVNGSLTPMGRRRVGAKAADKMDRHAVKQYAIKNSQKDWQAVGELGSSTSNTLRNTANVVGRITPKRMDLSHMSDQELRQKINRMQMENQYTNLTAARTKSAIGRQRAADALEVAGNVAMVGGSIAGMALAISKLKYGTIGKK